MRKFGRLWSMAAIMGLLAAQPAFADIPMVAPPPVESTESAESAGSPVDGPGGDITQGNQPVDTTPSGPGPAEDQAGQENQQEGPAADRGQAGPPVSTENGSTLKEPVVAAQGAVLMDAATGELLFAKNAETKYYPASITKLMTALLTAERCGLDDTVTFSKTATTNLEAGAVTLKLAEGDKLTVRQCMYGLLLKSANEVANGLAENVSGSISAFADLMNRRARELGCSNTHFVNPNGLNNSNHYTTPHDMALIGRAAFENQVVAKVASTLSYEFPATKNAGARTISLGHKMLYPNDSRYYPGVIGGKTGYTSLAGNTLVTCAEKNGVRLIAVVMKSKTTQYTDTKTLLDYGFALKTGGVPTASNPGSAANSKTAENPAAAANSKTVENSRTGWAADGSRWYYIKADQNRAVNEWLTVDGKDYWFDSDAYMAVGWRQFSNDAWYYFHSNGAMAASCWVQNNGKWFYLGENGAMLTSTTTPDGYKVDAAGVCLDA